MPFADLLRNAAQALLILTLAFPAAQSQAAPPLMLANSYQPDIDLSAYWVSEKYDGVRGYWDGAQMLTRGGARIIAPEWFVQGLPPIALDGELWAGHGRFLET